MHAHAHARAKLLTPSLPTILTPIPAKQSTLATFLEDAQGSGKLRLVARAHVDKILRAETGQAIGVIATVVEVRLIVDW